MPEYPFTQADLDVLAQWDTPTICNGLEVVVPERRAIGFTVEPMVCIDHKAKPIVGLARVGMIRSTEPPRSKVTDRADWYDYVARVDFPTIAVLQDIDGRVGYGMCQDNQPLRELTPRRARRWTETQPQVA